MAASAAFGMLPPPGDVQPGAASAAPGMATAFGGGAIVRARASGGSADVPADVLQSCGTVAELATASGLSPAAWQFLDGKLGVPDAFEDIALLERKDISDLMTADPMEDFQPSLVDKSRAVRFWRACRIRCGLGGGDGPARAGPAPCTGPAT